jgi:hypothetical protein
MEKKGRGNSQRGGGYLKDSIKNGYINSSLIELGAKNKKLLPEESWGSLS